MDTAQILLYVVVGVLTLLLVVLGIQVFFILRELKNTISRANKVLDDAGVISESISKPVESLSTVISGGKIVSIIASLLSGANKKHTKEGK
ncbi:MAG TPA: hypothetical protein VEW42_06550 [Candidatus Eisenbacteria bacterium]|nr:hypothetical protein [Candidatus Eisenbacteria bacterium]